MKLVEPVLAEEGFELVECSVSYTARSQAFRFSIDREEGVPVEACARVSRKIAILLDGNPLLRGAYQLEVSSPGMDRPVWSVDHFRRFRGERIRFELHDAPRPGPLQGIIGAVEGDGVWILQEGGGADLYPIARITRAHLHLDPWKKRSDLPAGPSAGEGGAVSATGPVRRGGRTGSGHGKGSTRRTGF